MTKSELIKVVVARLQHLTQKDAEIIVNAIFDSMMDTLEKGDRVEIRGFGNFSVKQRAERQGRNPKTGELIQIPAKRVPLFKSGKELSGRVNQKVI